MKILFLTYQGDIAGSTNSINYLARGLAARGHQVYMGCREEALLVRLLEGSGVTIIPMRFGGKTDRSNIRHIASVVQEHQIDIICPQSSRDRYTAGFAKWWYNLSAKVVHVRRQMPESDGIALVNWFIRKTADKVVAVSEPIREAISKAQGLPAAMLEVIHNGTPPEKYELPDLAARSASLREQHGLSAKMPVIGCVSRLKQQEQLIRALALVTTPVQVLFTGITQQEGWQELIDQYPVGHQLHFLGIVPAGEILYYYPLFDIKVLASDMEGLSQSLLEAMAMGVPVIATNSAGNPDLIRHERNGLLFEDGNTRQLADQINALLASAERRHELAREGKKTAMVDFSIKKTISHYEAFFEQLIT